MEVPQAILVVMLVCSLSIDIVRGDDDLRQAAERLAALRLPTRQPDQRVRIQFARAALKLAGLREGGRGDVDAAAFMDWPPGAHSAFASLIAAVAPEDDRARRLRLLTWLVGADRARS